MFEIALIAIAILVVALTLDVPLPYCFGGAMADMADFAEMNAIWVSWVPEGHAPARACGDAKLARPELKGRDLRTNGWC